METITIVSELEEVDKEYEMIECKNCRGTGQLESGDVCPICRGSKKVLARNGQVLWTGSEV